jgi:glyoxylase-like metal-dependent hydrolase (beta-lactamase superfamily II)
VILAAAIVLVGKGFLTDGSHPKHPGDFQKYDASVRIELDAESGVASIAIETGEGDKKDVDRYFVRRGRTFQVDDKGEEIPAKDFGDLSVPAIAALHPTLVESALYERREHAREMPDGTRAFSWNDVLWVVSTADKGKTVVSLIRNRFDDVTGAGKEQVAYKRSPDQVSVRVNERVVGEFAFQKAEQLAKVEIPKGDGRRDRGHVIEASEIAFAEIAPHLFSIDLASTSSRVFVVEFADHLAILEGAYSSRNGDLIARAVKERFGKPVRWHAFSHLHGQYVGSTRSWIAEGATILVPPSTVPLIEKMAPRFAASLRPDAQQKVAAPLKLETIERSRKLEDSTNALEIFNVPSEHTDEYFVFWFPGPKILLTGDLLFYRPGKPLSGRSKRLCQTVAELGIEPERLVATWPLEGYETKNIVTGEEFKAACAPAP